MFLPNNSTAVLAAVIVHNADKALVCTVIALPFLFLASMALCKVAYAKDS